MPTLTDEQRDAVSRAGNAPVEIADLATGASYVLVSSELFRRMNELLDDVEELRESEAWAEVSRRAQNCGAEKNPG